MKLENPGQIFLNSLDEGDTTQLYKNIKVRNEVAMRVQIITEMYESGAPNLEAFNKRSLETKYTFKPGQVVDLVDNHYCRETYWFDNGIWFMTEKDTTYLIDELLRD